MPQTSQFAAPSITSACTRLNAELEKLTPEIIGFRRHLHQHPELSLQEYATSAYIAEKLNAEGIAYRFGSEKRGVMVDFGTPKVAMRADCDALPIQEENTFLHASRNGKFPDK